MCIRDRKSTDADIARIETVVPYDGDYNSVVNQGQDEVNSGYCPEIKPVSYTHLDVYKRQLYKTPVTNLNGIGEKRAALFARLGIKSVGDLINFYPRTYERCV